MPKLFLQKKKEFQLNLHLGVSGAETARSSVGWWSFGGFYFSSSASLVASCYYWICDQLVHLQSPGKGFLMRMEAPGLWYETETAAAHEEQIRSIGNADLKHVKNMTASTHTLGKGFLNLLNEWQKDYISFIHMYICRYVYSSKKQCATSPLNCMLSIGEIFIGLVRLLKLFCFPAGDLSQTDPH